MTYNVIHEYKLFFGVIKRDNGIVYSIFIMIVTDWTSKQHNIYRYSSYRL